MCEMIMVTSGTIATKPMVSERRGDVFALLYNILVSVREGDRDREKERGNHFLIRESKQFKVGCKQCYALQIHMKRFVGHKWQSN